MRRGIVTSVIDVDKGPVDDGHGLEEVGEHLGQVVAVLEGHAGVEDDVNLDEELVAGVVGAQVLDAADGGGEAHGEVEEEVALVGLGGKAGEVADVVSRGLAPLEDDEDGEEETA
jgi:NTP pyrophosphatase (non-canonical NTP hydrolase)